MAQDSPRNDFTSDVFDFSPETLLDSEQPTFDFDLFANSSSGLSLDMNHHYGSLASSASAQAISNGTVSPQDLFNEPFSAPPSAAFTNMSTPATAFDSPAAHSADESPLITGDIGDHGSAWPSLFPTEHQSPDEDAVQPSIEPNATAMSRVHSSPSHSHAHSHRHSSVAGVKARKRDKPLPPITKDPQDSPELAKRKRNTEAARKSRAKKQNTMEALQATVQDLQAQVDYYRRWAETGRKPELPIGDGHFDE